MEKRIIDFLIKAKKATYAGKGVEKEPSRPHSHDLDYIEGELTYIDTYLGGYSFAGEEALWEHDQPFWAMNYIGRVLSDEFDGDFLKEALSVISEDKPFRGPETFLRDNYEYKCKIEGDFAWFSGEEAIHYKGLKVYECIFHGGNIIK